MHRGVMRRVSCCPGRADPMIASASISTRQRSSSRAATTTMVAAGRMSPKIGTVRASDSLPVSRIDQEHARPDDVRRHVAPAARQRVEDDGQAACGLGLRVGIDRPVRPDRASAGHHDPVTHAHRTTEADDRLIGRPGRDALALSHRAATPTGMSTPG